MEIIQPVADVGLNEAKFIKIVLDSTDPIGERGFAVRRRGETIWPDPDKLDFPGGADDITVSAAEPGDYELTIDFVAACNAATGIMTTTGFEWRNGSNTDHPVLHQFRVGGHAVHRIQLMGPAATASVAPIGTPVASYDGFVEFVRGKLFTVDPITGVSVPDNVRLRRLLGVGTTDGDGKLLAGPTPEFGAGPDTYDRLLDLARAYAKDCRINTLGDLFPPGYLDGRRLAEPHFAADPITGEVGEDVPCIELIWNYWLEEGMLVQTLNHIVARFQNRRVSNGDPLARFDVSPLLPLRSLLWTWVENEHRRLTVRRRAAEYLFEYGLPLIGRAVPRADSYVERRGGFLRSFHTVLHLATRFFKELDDLTITADGFPLYEALRECHLVLSQGSQNQYGEMAIAARAEMLSMQHILAQPPMREFLGGRPMTPYPEPWMDRVDSMKAIQGWSDASVLHFHDLATFGEQLVITIRLGNWAAPAVAGTDAADWATAFRPMIQRYIAAYRAVTGVDLAAGVDATVPSQLIARRMADARVRA